MKDDDDDEDECNEKHRLIIYENELEKQAEFNCFEDWATPMALIKKGSNRKHPENDQESYGILKCRVNVQKYLRTDRKFSKDPINSK